MTQATIPMIESPTPVGRPMMRDKFCCTGSRVVGGAVGVAVGNRTVEGEKIVDCHFKNQIYMYVVSAPGPKNSLAYPVIFVGFACMAQETQPRPQATPRFHQAVVEKNRQFSSQLRDTYNLRVARGMRLQETNVQNIFTSPQEKI